MTASEIVAHGGYAAVMVGTFFEGETVMLAAGVAACAGLMSLPLVILSSVTGIFASDTFCFLVGRYAAGSVARRFPRWCAKLDGAFRLIERHDQRLLVFYQFFPGLCAITPLAFGMTRIPARRFLVLDLLGNVTWTVTFALAGYGAGAGFLHLFARHS